MKRLKNWFMVRFFPSHFLKKINSQMDRRIFFIREYEGMMRRIWKGEFVLKNRKGLREDIRRERDKSVELIDAAIIALEKNAARPEPDKTIKDNLESGIEKRKLDITQIEKQIDGIDGEIQEADKEIEALRSNLPLLEEMVNE